MGKPIDEPYPPRGLILAQKATGHGPRSSASRPRDLLEPPDDYADRGRHGKQVPASLTAFGDLLGIAAVGATPTLLRMDLSLTEATHVLGMLPWGLEVLV